MDRDTDSKLIEPHTLKVKNTFIEPEFDEMSRADDPHTGTDFCRIATEPMPSTSKLLEHLAPIASTAGAEQPSQSSFFREEGTRSPQESESADSGCIPETPPDTDSISSRHSESQRQCGTFSGTMAGAATPLSLSGLPWPVSTAATSSSSAWPMIPTSLGKASDDSLASAAAFDANDFLTLQSSWANIYTVMMRNLPNSVTQQQVLSEINNGGFLHTYDFLYLPIDPDTHSNQGYVFLNFAAQGMALTFKMHFEGRQFCNFQLAKALSVVPATLQGFEANYAHYVSAHIQYSNPSERPLFFREPMLTRHEGQSLIDMASKRLWNQQRKGQVKQQKPQANHNATNVAAAPSTGAAEAGPSKPAVESGLWVAKFCHNCGGSIHAKYKFCSICGSPTLPG